uniref:Stage II sporulation protein M n=1 Tax=Cyanothece sp. (strain PCC 7425 / ATCC 29141) TaxID=395961 RepID=B8HW59_CYAP4
MDVQRWLARQEPKWSQLETLLQKSEQKGLRSLTVQEVQQLSSLYRTVSADLARVRSRNLGSGLGEYLQNLALRGYGQVYQGRRRSSWRAIVQFYRWEFPALVRQTWLYTALATAIFLLGGLIAWWYAWRDPDFLPLVVPSRILNLVQKEGKLWMGSIVGIEPLASSWIMTNNIAVSFATLAGGMMAGLGTLFILWNNGIHIGAIATLVGQHDLAYPFWAFVLPHGALELPAIFLAGGAGLLLGQALLFPGRYRRMVALTQNGAQAIYLMFGVVPLLVIAGVIEGFFSPNPLVPNSIKYLAGTLIFLGLLVYLSSRPDTSS